MHPSISPPPSPTHMLVHRTTNKHAHVRNKKEIKKMELLTVVLTILADGGFVLRCRAKAGNTEIYLEGVEAVGFLREEVIL